MEEDRLVELDRRECLRLLASAQVGRVVHTDRALPACTPVSFRLVGPAVVFRTSPGSRLAAATADAVVAFEVDEIDPATSTGWSVLVRGVASAVRDVSALVRLEQLGLVPWAGPDRPHWVHIAIADVTGRRLAPLAASSGETALAV
jgi:nitroimidazol reductase NimA-like FMN-containing flavoprotein (pyridoxamine 5'-phosphate oxidase superfamily)